ncbi:hypothetical protein F2Q70_00038642 [Brassica cretica]|uniref:Uncharacterized protein n=1 Tax=Brassica cretica TaxID=69181 RepID=A0A8S9K9E3_BRACR|nr:hypothetical protein F2Q70_00038642 [Brassica cretica]
MSTQVSQIAEAVKEQTLFKRNDIVQSGIVHRDTVHPDTIHPDAEEHQVNSIFDNYFGEVIKQEKLDEEAF